MLRQKDVLVPKEGELGTINTGGVSRCAKSFVFKGLRKLFLCTLLRKKLPFKQKPTAYGSAFSASDVTCLWGKGVFHFNLLWRHPMEKKGLRHSVDEPIDKSMDVHTHVHTHTHMHIHTNIHTGIHTTRVCLYTHLHTRTHAYMHGHTCTCIHTYIHMWLCA